MGEVHDFTEDGVCSQCGACCSNYLPLSESEITRIKRYVKKHNIKEKKRSFPLNAVIIDATCPFLELNKSKERCTIYPVRGAVCKYFICSEPYGALNYPELYKETHQCVDMRETFFGKLQNKRRHL